ncbi:MAG: aspartate/glutamate racemase family protein, partial [Lachnospiraceae bacterium]|nr:aspartate/glutamate racemase family protein [Lachnospiraceae bacterium]
IVELTVAAITSLLPSDPKAVVIACNTATAAALPQVQAACGEVPVIGIKPDVERASAAEGTHRILALATQSTINSDSFAAQLKALEEKGDNNVIIPMGAPCIVRYVEGNKKDWDGVTAELKEQFSALDAPVDEVVLGCTHFPFAKEAIRASLGYDVTFFDAGEKVAETTRDILEQRSLLTDDPGRGSITFLNSKNDPEMIRFSYTLFSMDM